MAGQRGSQHLAWYHRYLHRGREQRFLGPGVVMHELGVDLGSSRDPPDRGPVVAEVGELSPGRLGDCLPGPAVACPPAARPAAATSRPSTPLTANRLA